MSGARAIRTLLVANRGEIALRIMRTARAEGITCVAVYTDADADAPLVRFADRAVRIGAGPVAQSYLSIDRILQAARESGADAVHPGYGFLSESAAFATACVDAGLCFVGPPAKAVAAMGDKAEARRIMQAAGVPCVPGYDSAAQDDATLTQAADEIGYPLMVKAAAGGGGRGMRRVGTAQALAPALTQARAEALAAFGDDTLILEHAVASARHIEIQVFADAHGCVVHLGERDCSVQRRHQKVIEEAPAPGMTADLRAAMGSAAVEAARAVGYEGAGTVEFLLGPDGRFYFLEMNTRLQVEHPVTEMITGHDLVALQLAVARGEPLGFRQEDVQLEGHAIEVRLYAEDPANGFLPATGRITHWQPATGPGIRIDAGIDGAQEVSPFYDPMLAKIIAHGPKRQIARQRLIGAVQDSLVFGVTTNRDFLLAALAHPTFANGAATTAFIDEERAQLVPDAGIGFAEVALAAMVLFRDLHARAAGAALAAPGDLSGWSSSGALVTRLLLADETRQHAVSVTSDRDGGLVISNGKHSVTVTGEGRDTRIDGQGADLRAAKVAGDRVNVATGARQYHLDRVRPGLAAAATASAGAVHAPMHGILVDVFAGPGARVSAGDRLAVLEAMKMQHELRAPCDGTIQAVLAAAGDQVRAGSLLFDIAAD